MSKWEKVSDKIAILYSPKYGTLNVIDEESFNLAFKFIDMASKQIIKLKHK